MPVKTADELSELTRSILVALGASEKNANRVADGLVSAHLAGHDSHGVQQLANYVKSIKAGEIVPAAEPQIVRETANAALVSGNWTFGHVAAEYATQVALEKASKSTVSVVGMVETNHIGRVGEYAEMAAAASMVGIIAAGGFGVGFPVAVPYGGRKPLLSTNPIAMGFPADESPMILDFATTITSGGKLMLARAKGEQAPPGYLIDKDGNPTTDPAVFWEGGAMVPFGGHKGSAVMMAVEFLGRILTGADKFAVSERGGPIMRHQGVTIIAINPAFFQSLEDYLGRATELMQQVRSTPPASGFREVLAPGDPEHRARLERRLRGIQIPDSTWRELVGIAESLGVHVASQ